MMCIGFTLIYALWFHLSCAWMMMMMIIQAHESSSSSSSLLLHMLGSGASAVIVVWRVDTIFTCCFSRIWGQVRLAPSKVTCAFRNPSRSGHLLEIKATVFHLIVQYSAAYQYSVKVYWLHIFCIKCCLNLAARSILKLFSLPLHTYCTS